MEARWELYWGETLGGTVEKKAKKAVVVEESTISTPKVDEMVEDALEEIEKMETIEGDVDAIRARYEDLIGKAPNRYKNNAEWMADRINSLLEG